MIYTVEIDGIPTISFEALSESDANEYVKLDEFRQDLSQMSSNGVPVCNSVSLLQLRQASSVEMNTYRSACATPSNDEWPTFVLLIRVDGVLVHSVQPD